MQTAASRLILSLNHLLKKKETSSFFRAGTKILINLCFFFLYTEIFNHYKFSSLSHWRWWCSGFPGKLIQESGWSVSPSRNSGIYITCTLLELRTATKHCKNNFIFNFWFKGSAFAGCVFQNCILVRLPQSKSYRTTTLQHCTYNIINVKVICPKTWSFNDLARCEKNSQPPLCRDSEIG